MCWCQGHDADSKDDRKSTSCKGRCAGARVMVPTVRMIGKSTSCKGRCAGGRFIVLKVF